MTEAQNMHNINSNAPPHLAYKDGVRIAYHQTPGRLPGVMFLGGFKSDMTGSKALALEALCKKEGRAFVRFDYQGHGASSGQFVDGTIGEWLNDALAVFDQLTTGPQIVVGSSMGGWLSLLLALKRKERVAGMVGIAPAPDFTEQLIWEKLTDEQRKDILEKGVFYAPSCYGEDPYPITLNLIIEARRHLLLHKPIPIHCQVRLIHGKQDEDVPWQTSFTLKAQLESQDVRVEMVEDGRHRMSEPANLELLCKTVKEMADQF